MKKGVGYMITGLEIKIIEFNSKEYRAELELRNEILRIPLGMNIYEEALDDDILDIHIGAFIDDRLIGCLLLTAINSRVIKMRQVAVNEEYQGRSIGSKMVSYAEDYAISQGYQKLTLHARKNAAKFYQKLNYEVYGEEFREVNIPHYAMQKYL